MNYSSGGYYQPPENNNYQNNQNWHFGPKPPHFVPMEIWVKEKIYIRKLSAVAGICVLLFIIFSGIFVGIFQALFAVLERIRSFDYASFQRIWNSAEFQYLFETIYSILIVGGPFFVVGWYCNRKGVIGQIPTGKPKNAKFLPIIILGAFGICLFGNIITTYIDIFFETVTGVGMEMPAMPETPHSVGGVLLYYLSTAVVPALIEEMALRGVIMQPLRRYGDWFAIICSALIFGLMHCNLLQIPFAFIAGIAIGYAVVVTESVWTGIIIHFLNNAFAVTVSIIDDFYGLDSVQYMISNVVFYTVIVVGLLCAFFYVRKIQKEPFRKSPIVNQSKDLIGVLPPFSAKISNGTLFKTYLATVPMIIAFIAVVYETVVTMMIL